MLFLKSTADPVAPGIYAVDVAAKPPGKTFMIYAAVDAAEMPTSFIKTVEGMGFKQMRSRSYKHADGTQIVDLHFQKAGTDIFDGWTDAEREVNLQMIEKTMGEFNIKINPRVMSLAEAFR
jgi:hypothetical protein